jgi:hypothetical protein
MAWKRSSVRSRSGPPTINNLQHPFPPARCRLVSDFERRLQTYALGKSPASLGNLLHTDIGCTRLPMLVIAEVKAVPPIPCTETRVPPASATMENHRAREWTATAFGRALERFVKRRSSLPAPNPNRAFAHDDQCQQNVVWPIFSRRPAHQGCVQRGSAVRRKFILEAPARHGSSVRTHNLTRIECGVGLMLRSAGQILTWAAFWTRRSCSEANRFRGSRG